MVSQKCRVQIYASIKTNGSAEKHSPSQYLDHREAAFLLIVERLPCFWSSYTKTEALCVPQFVVTGVKLVTRFYERTTCFKVCS